MKATKTTRSNTTLKVTGTRYGEERTLVLDFATDELAREARTSLRGKGLTFCISSPTTRFCDAETAVADTLSFFNK